MIVLADYSEGSGKAKCESAYESITSAVLNSIGYDLFLDGTVEPIGSGRGFILEMELAVIIRFDGA